MRKTCFRIFNLWYNFIMQRKEPFVEKEFYHIYNRGNSKQLIFLDDHDRNRFLKLLYLCNSQKSIDFREDIVRRKIDAWEFKRGESLVSIGAWVLMPNHFHLLITIPKSNIKNKSKIVKDDSKNRISMFMHKAFTSYSKYFNAKHQRNGKLFENEFRSSRTDSDEYLKYVFSYIHLNPIKLIDKKWKEDGIKDIEKARTFLKNYEWSSYQDYIGKKRPENKIITKEDFPAYFENIQIFEKEILDWLSFSEVQ